MIEMMSQYERELLGHSILRNAIYSLNARLSEETGKMEPFAYKQMKVDAIMNAIFLFQEIFNAEFSHIREADNSKAWEEC